MIEFIEIGLLLAIYLLIFYILGAALAVKLRWTMRRSQCLLIGFFAYFFRLPSGIPCPPHLVWSNEKGGMKHGRDGKG